MKKSSRKLTWLLVLGSFIACGFLGYKYIYKQLDTKAPQITNVDNLIYIKPDREFSIDMYDDTGLTFYEISLTDGKETIPIKSQNLNNSKRLSLKVKIPKVNLFLDKKNLKLVISARDSSWWNFGLGNSATKSIKVIFDNKNPQINIISMSKRIKKGGAALIIFQALDENLEEKDLHIKTHFGKAFKPVQFIKQGYYASLVVWPVYEKKFNANIIAIDKAGNKTVKIIPIYKRNKAYKTSNIKISSKFLDNTIAKLYNIVNPTDDNLSLTNLHRFVQLNSKQRQENENILAAITSNPTPYSDFENFEIKPFYPLRGGARVGSFGDYRIFTKNNKKVSTSYHLGLDLASVKHADIVSSNNGVVVYSEYNGIYGNTIVINHGMGLHSTYSHTSRALVYEQNEVTVGQVIAKTGESGLALGDHLHFGLFIQGLEARPAEWMDKKWINIYINTVINNAIKHINEQA